MGETNQQAMVEGGGGDKSASWEHLGSGGSGNH